MDAYNIGGKLLRRMSCQGSGRLEFLWISARVEKGKLCPANDCFQMHRILEVRELLNVFVTWLP